MSITILNTLTNLVNKRTTYRIPKFLLDNDNAYFSFYIQELDECLNMLSK